MRTFQEFISEASKIYPSSVNQVAVRKKENKDRKTAGDDMYSKQMPRASGGPEPIRTPESTAAIKRRENLPPETKLRNIENDEAHQKGLKTQALHNITTGNTPPPTEGESSEDREENFRKERIRRYGSLNPMRHTDEPEKYAHELPQQIPARKPPSSTPKAAPAAPIKKTKRPTPAPIKKG